MKKFLINFSLVIIIFISFILQNSFFTVFNINGVMPNLLVLLIVFIGLFANKSYGLIYGIVIRLLYDFMYSQIIGIVPVVLGTIGFLVGLFDKNFSKDNKLTILIIATIATIVFEVSVLCINFLIYRFDFKFFAILRTLAIEILFNDLLVIILYPLIQKFGFYIENEYKGNKILTRYF